MGYRRRLINRASMMLCFSLCALRSHCWEQQEAILGQVLAELPLSYLVQLCWTASAPWVRTSKGFYGLVIICPEASPISLQTGAWILKPIHLLCE